MALFTHKVRLHNKEALTLYTAAKMAPILDWALAS